MNILVCVKQVPDTTEIKIDPHSNTLIRTGVPSILNPFDAYALEMAVRLKEKNGGTVTAISMGPEQAKNVLKECLSVGADQAFLVSDRIFGGSDTLATSYILSAAICKLGEFDVIFCGKQAIDGDTAQVGPELAEHLDIAQVTYVVEVEATDRILTVLREIDERYEKIETQIPTLLTVNKTAFEPRYPTVKSKLTANRTTINTITSADLDLDLTRIGLKGSPTKVKKTFVPVQRKKGLRIMENSGRQSAIRLVEVLLDAKII